MREAFTSIMSGEVSAAQIAAFLVGLKMRGETPSDIAAGAQTLRAMATTITAPEGLLILWVLAAMAWALTTFQRPQRLC